MQDDTHAIGSSRELTGRRVFVYFVAFFAVVFAANFVMFRAATSTFGGLETESAYKAGLAFKQELAAVRAQDGLKWQVNAHVERNAAGEATVSVDVRDQRGMPVSSLDVRASLLHPLISRYDQPVVLSHAQPGRFVGNAPLAAGQWTLAIDIMRGDERVFRSRSRVVLK
ncbi:MAG: FixH family protein [Pseudorhodoplanes sp.]|nr:FixH family protein [Pseudorhodoplanes sp.]